MPPTPFAKKWARLVDASTIVWIVAFLLGLFTTDTVKAYCGYITLFLLPVFICDLILIFRQEKHFKTFIKNRWFDVLLVIPYFRIFRIFRFARALKILRITRLKRILGVTKFIKKSRKIARISNRKPE